VPARAPALPLLLLLAAAKPVDAGAGLLSILPRVHHQDIQSKTEGDLLTDLGAALGDRSRMSEARLGLLEESLRPAFQALPKREGGGLGAPAARHALHRLFLQAHGWQVKGLAPEGQAWDSRSPLDALGERVPEQVRAYFEARLAGDGLSLRELATLAVGVDQLVHAEALARLRTIWGELRMPENVGPPEADAVMDTFMAMDIFGALVEDAVNASTRVSTIQQLLKQESVVLSMYPAFNATKIWLREVREDVRPQLLRFSFGDVAAVLEAAVEQNARHQAADCREIKDQLVSMEESPGSGRLPLSDFYAAALQSEESQFHESIGYLRQLGALDETKPGAPQVLISNYVSSPANCLTTGDHYHTGCCADECGSLLDHLEREIAAPGATPEGILAAVATLPGAAAHASRGGLPPALVNRLQEVAQLHGGLVPLHGRLFAQWLHLAYPRECPYPHVSGTTSPVAAREWERLGGTESATEEEMLQYTTPAHAPTGARRVVQKWAMRQVGVGAAATELSARVWTTEEEVLAGGGAPERASASADPQAMPPYASFLVGAATFAAIAGTRMMTTLDVPEIRSADTGAPVKPVYNF